jgi:tetratricopeptide (TPR) repeat protein
MKKAVIAVSLLLSLTAYADEWISPIDKKYESQNRQLFEQVLKARELLDSTSGPEGKLKKADDLLRVVLEKSPRFAPALREYGRLYIMSGQVNSNNFRPGGVSPAEASILKSIAIEPNYADSYVLLGHLYTNMNRDAEAQIALETAEKIGTKNPWLNLNWADLLVKRQQYTEAIPRYQIVVDRKSKTKSIHSSALFGLAMTYWHLNQFDKAKEMHKKVIAYDPNNAWNWSNYASFLLYSFNEPDAAIFNARKALTIKDYDAARFILACALYTKWANLQQTNKLKNDAQKYFDEAISLYPNLEDVVANTEQFSSTKITASELTKYLKRKL